MNKTLAYTICVIGLVLGFGVLAAGSCFARQLAESSQLNLESQKIKYEYAYRVLQASNDQSLSFQDGGVDEFGHPNKGLKSPLKAFLLSAAVPGLGQWYYGNKWKAVAFFGADVATWTLAWKWHKDGEDATTVYEAFNDAHWSRDDYEMKFLYWSYGVTDDELVNQREISHHLPDTKTQQYYEMTGKYDQFSWGWDDAEYQGTVLGDYGQGNPPPQLNDPSHVPHSARRDYYENLRDDANKKFDRARKMVVVAIVNRLVSSLEAYFTTKSHNDKEDKKELSDLVPKVFTSVKVKASLKSYHEKHDTPYVKVTYKF